MDFRHWLLASMAAVALAAVATKAARSRQQEALPEARGQAPEGLGGSRPEPRVA